jgi:tetratricopeptide (TPR) repeat protein
MLISSILYAQQPGKQEVEEMQKMMQQMKSDPDMQKAMKQFGMDSNTIEKMMNDNSFSDGGSYYEFDEFQTPKKNQGRINSVPKQRLTNAGLPSYLTTLAKCLDASLSAENRKMVDLLYSTAKLHPDTLANMASGLWMTGNYIPAAFLMAKACQLKPNVTNLNNCAAFLVMTGGEELALPILQKLNRENPENATILNNIGQAWFGLGDLDKAKIYLDSTTMIFANHSQANQTKCVIQESKGNKTGAIQSMKQSVKGAYTPTKEAMLRKLGYKVEGADLSHSALHMPSDPLGFAKWMAIIPPFPKSYKEQMLFAPRWKDFYQEIRDEQTKLQEKAARLNIEYADSLVKRQKKFAANPNQNQFKEPYLSAQANKVDNPD